MRPFLIVWLGQACSLLGSQLVQFALVWWLTKTTGSATTLALASLAALLPQILIGPFAGALVDRWSRRTIMIVADAAIALATLVLAALFWLNVAAVWNIYMSVAQVMAPLGLLIAGPFADAFGVRLWWVLTGIVIAVMGTSALFVPAIVHIEDRRHSGEIL